MRLVFTLKPMVPRIQASVDVKSCYSDKSYSLYMYNATAKNSSTCSQNLNAVYHIGDTSYADNDFLSLSSFADFFCEETYNHWLAPVRHRVPYMVLAVIFVFTFVWMLTGPQMASRKLGVRVNTSAPP